MAQTFVIAEAGSSHDGALERARALVCAAASSSADACKFQFWSNADKLATRRHVPESYRAVYHRYALPESWLPILADDCEKAGIAFMATAYLPEDVVRVEPFVAHWKVASFEAEASDLLEAHLPFIDRDLINKRHRFLLVSLGMNANTDVIHDAIGCGGPRWRLVRYLHCVSAYPCPIDQLNLARVAAEDGPDGFSDHSDPTETWTGALAVAACAGDPNERFIEAHLRLDETDPANPDYQHAMTPSQFAQYVKNIRFAEQCLGDGEKRLQACEIAMTRYQVKAKRGSNVRD